MQSLSEEMCVETLRARYAELLRLREYVERLEKIHSAKSNSDTTADILEDEPARAPQVIGLFG